VSIGAGVGLVDARHIAHIRAPLRLLVDNSTVRANQALVFVALSLVQLSDAAIDAWLYPTATLAVHVTNGSVLSLATQLTTWEDVCSLVSCVDVHSNLSSALQLRVDGGSSVSINCATIATFLMLGQTTGISFMADVTNVSIVLLCRQVPDPLSSMAAAASAAAGGGWRYERSAAATFFCICGLLFARFSWRNVTARTMMCEFFISFPFVAQARLYFQFGWIAKRSNRNGLQPRD
jgi:hypothetical protein